MAIAEAIMASTVAVHMSRREKATSLQEAWGRPQPSQGWLTGTPW